jgi:hypothetical protein
MAGYVYIFSWENLLAGKPMECIPIPRYTRLDAFFTGARYARKRLLKARRYYR